MNLVMRTRSKYITDLHEQFAEYHRLKHDLTVLRCFANFRPVIRSSLFVSGKVFHLFTGVIFSIRYHHFDLFLKLFLPVLGVYP